ncbi:double zinc ribbon domain-containing protein [Haloplanus salinarum]|uniref:double zinc ribbon domain-containing protein n=2 Tax=Haloplanus salinarum TaxID=1912324 RepID=UPI003B42975C
MSGWSPATAAPYSTTDSVCATTILPACESTDFNLGPSDMFEYREVSSTPSAPGPRPGFRRVAVGERRPDGTGTGGRGNLYSHPRIMFSDNEVLGASPVGVGAAVSHGRQPMPSTCPNCDGRVPSDGDFCPNCGESLSTNCPGCGESLPIDAQFCANCGQDLTSSTGQRGSGNAAGGGSWRLGDDEFAKRVDGAALDGDGLLATLSRRKDVEIEAGNRALLLENGKLVETLEAGKHKLDSLGKRIRELRSSHNLTVVLVQEGRTTVARSFDDIRTASDYLVDVTVELDVGMHDPQTFFRSMMADRDVLTTGTFNQLLGRAIRNALEATISEYDHQELYGSKEVKRRVAREIEEQCRSVLESNGLELVELVSFDYDDDRGEIRQGRKDVDIREEKEEIKDRESELDRRGRERQTEDKVHGEKQRVRKESAEMSADHTLDKQEVEQQQEIDDKRRRHGHKAEREDVEHEEDVRTYRTESEVEREDIRHEQEMKEREQEHEQDVSEIEDLVDLKRKKDEQKLDKQERKQEMEMQKESHEVDVEKERLEARDDVDAQTLASMEDTDEEMIDLAKMDKAENLNADQLDSLGAQKSDELAKARQEANSAEKERERVEDQKQFREEMQDMMEGSMDRMERTTDKAMDSMGGAAEAAAEDTSDNVIVSGEGGDSSGGDTTIVQGGPGGGGDGTTAESDGGADEPEKIIVCPSCGSEEPYANDFCMGCGQEF